MNLISLFRLNKINLFLLILLLITSCADTKIEAIHPMNQKEQNLVTVNVIGQDSSNRGSGTLIGAYHDGNQYIYYVLTASHLVNGARGGDRFQIKTNREKLLYSTDVISQYEDIDLAILRFRSKSKYSIIPLIRQKPSENHQTFISGFKYCAGESKDEKKEFQHYSTSGKIENYDMKIKDMKKSDLKNDLSKSDLYFTNSAVIGMSGGPVINKSGQMVAIQLSTPLISDTMNIKNCDYPPEYGGSFGISTNKFLTQEILSEVRTSFILEDIKIVDDSRDITPSPSTSTKPHSPVVVDGDK